MIESISNVLLGSDLTSTLVNIVTFISVVQLVGFLFLMIGSFVGTGRR